MPTNLNRIYIEKTKSRITGLGTSKGQEGNK